MNTTATTWGSGPLYWALSNRTYAVNATKPEITDIMGRWTNSVLGSTLDVKTNAPATILYRLLGPSTTPTVANALIRIRYDSTNEPHQFLYGTNETVRILGDGDDETPTDLGTNCFEIIWDGRDDRTNENRLLLGGNFRFDVSLSLVEAGGATCTSCVVTQQVAKPHAGHFTGDWPRSSAYTNTQVPEGGKLEFRPSTNSHDENTSDSIYVTLDQVYEDEKDGGWGYLSMRFQFETDPTPDVWMVYSPTSWALPKGMSNDTLVYSTNAVLSVEEIKFQSYPTSRLAFIAKYNGTDYDVYTNRNFWSSGTNYVDTGRNISAGGTQWFSFDGSPDNHIKVRLTQNGGAPPMNTEVAILVFPYMEHNGIYNQTTNRDNLIWLNAYDFTQTPQDGATFTLGLFRGYSAWKFWSSSLAVPTQCVWGVDIDGGITGSNGYDSISYDTSNPKSTNDYGNLTPSEVYAKCTNTVGLMEIFAHGTYGWMEWYHRVYEAGDDNTTNELFDLPHCESITGAVMKNLQLDDVNLAILAGCHTAETNSSGDSMLMACTNAGVDIVLGWNQTQYPAMFLFTQHFLQRSFQKVGGATNEDLVPPIAISWTNYPTVDYARQAAYVDLTKDLLSAGTNVSQSAAYVYTNLCISGSGDYAAITNSKIYPARYGAKNK